MHFGVVMIVITIKIKDIIDEIKDTIEWILAGCPKPKPVKIPVKGKERAMENLNDYRLKVDDLLMKLLKDYHNIDASDVLSFFDERANEMFESEPNITNRSKKPVTHFVNNKTETFAHKYKNKSTSAFKKHLANIDVGKNKVYVLRGYYPETHIPFKMTLVKFHEQPTAISKVIIGLKEHHTRFNKKDISEYNNAVSEAILLSTEVKEDDKIKYEYRKFKCMKPKGMDLYHEKKDG